MTSPLIERLARINDPSLWSLVDDGFADNDILLSAARKSSLHKAALCVRETMGDIEKNAYELAPLVMETGGEPWKGPSRRYIADLLGYFANAFLAEAERMGR
jgi:hypothetical protein